MKEEMKILIESYSTCTQNESGGVQVRIKKIVELLRKKNITVDFFDKFNTKVIDYDILHIFMLNIENYELIKYAKKNGLKVVISTIVPLINGYKIDIYRKLVKLPIPTTYKILLQSLQLADLLIVETPAEKKFLIKHYNIDKNKIYIIPNGIEKDEVATRDIYNYIGGKKKYILQVGRFDKNKNQLNTIKALKNENIEVVFIGGPQSKNDKYYKKCQEEAKNKKNFHFLGWIDKNSKIIKSAYKNAELVIVPSFFETFGMVILEAIAAGKKIVVSETLPILEYNIISAENTFNPRNVNDIKKKTIKAFFSENNNINMQNVNENFEWSRIINKHIKCYKEILGEKDTKKNI